MSHGMAAYGLLSPTPDHHHAVDITVHEFAARWRRLAPVRLPTDISLSYAPTFRERVDTYTTRAEVLDRCVLSTAPTTTTAPDLGGYLTMWAKVTPKEGYVFKLPGRD